ncbi:flagellar hook-length control protein FliK [Stutzerimonas tarimensis]|uniref:Flagellar hook-length control protein FliK n=1 Tax=Stutzerimonas tarimensis TaxID=1507735 RepID=A0ABV7T8R0_9GAMM
MTEIRGSAPLPATSAPRAATAPTDFALRLLQPLQGLMAPGQSGRAEVIEVRQGAADFQLVLRLLMENGRQTTLSARTPGPVELGTAVAVTALADNRLLASLQPAARQPLPDLSALPPGTQIQARVVGQQPQADGSSTRLLVSLLNTPLAGRNLVVESGQPLAPGSLLTAQVRGDHALSLVPLSGRLDQLRVGEQLAAQFSRQGPLQALMQGLGPDSSRPAAVQHAAEQLLGLLPEASELGNARKLAQVLGNSGLFLEASLLGDQTEALPTDLKAGILRLVAQLLPGLPGASPLAALPHSGALSQALPAFARQMLGSLAQDPRLQALEFPLPSRLLQGLSEQPDLEMLLKLAAAAIARLQTHQLASLAQTQTTPDGLLLTTWQTEVPMRHGSDILPLQVWVQREEREPERRETDKALSLWRIELAFEIPPLGPLQIQAQLLDGTFSSQLWAEQPGTAQLISAELGTLRDRLQSAGLSVGELSCAQGCPPQGPRTSLEQRFVDETA